MILYCVDPPPSEADGDGEDKREWFGTLKAARKRFRELVAEGEAWVKARDARDDNPHNDELGEEAAELYPDWKYFRITLDKYDIPLKKANLVFELNHQLYGCRTTIEEWQD